MSQIADAKQELEYRRHRNGTRPKPVADLVRTPTAGPPLPQVEDKLPERITLDTLDPEHHPLVKKAIAAARSWGSRKLRSAGPGDRRISLVLVASQIARATVEEWADRRKLHGEERAAFVQAQLQLRSGYGCGKTHIARAIQWASYVALEDGTPVAPAGRFYTANNLLGLLGAGNTMGELAPAGTDTVTGRVGGTVALILDDVGAEEPLPYIAQGNQEGARHARYFEIVNYCYEKEISVVVTANLQIHELARWIGGRAWSRLNQMAPAGFIVNMTGVPDYRRIEGGRA